MEVMKSNLTDGIIELIRKKMALIKVHSKNFSVRLSKPYMPITQIQDREFPPKDKRSFDNYLTEIFDNEGFEFNFGFSNGDVSQIKTFELNSKKIQSKNCEISRVVLKYND